MPTEGSATCYSQFCLNDTSQMEEFSRAYIHAIASVAGYGVIEERPDQDSVDVRIKQYGTEHAMPIRQGLNVQAKCTYAHAPTDGFIKYPLLVKNYNELRLRSCEPRILVVVHVPHDVEEWLLQNDECIALHHCGYWFSLAGMPATQNRRTKTVHIPIEQKFTVETLRGFMNHLATNTSPLF